MARLRRQDYRDLKSEINIVPLLDILLVLLLIFMVTTPIITQSIKVDLPDGRSTQEINVNDSLPIIIEVSGGEKYNIIIEKSRMDQLPLEKVVIEAKRLLETNPKMVFLIGGTKDVSYNEVIKVLNLLQNAGVKSVGLMTHPV